MIRDRRIRGLAALNGVLLIALALVALAPPADAQREGRARSEFTMVAGEVQGLTEQAIYVLDGTNQELIALQWDVSRKTLETMGFRSLTDDAAQGEGGGR